MKLVTTIPRGKSIFEFLSGYRELDNAWIFVHANVVCELTKQSTTTSTTNKRTWFYTETENHVESSIAVLNSGVSPMWYAVDVITHKRIDYSPTDNPKRVIMLKLKD